MAFKITEPVIICFGLLELPKAGAELEVGLQVGPAALPQPQPHLLPPLLAQPRLAPRDLQSTGFLADRSHHHAALLYHRCTCGVPSSRPFSVRRKSLVPKSTQPSAAYLKVVAAERSLAAWGESY